MRVPMSYGSLPAHLPGRGRDWWERWGIGGGADDMPELAAHAVALQREPEPVSPVQHARHLGRAVILIERGALDPERRGPRGQLQQVRLIAGDLDDLDRAQRAAHLHAVQALQGRVERDLREVL